jgi:hypothetical protein
MQITRLAIVSANLAEKCRDWAGWRMCLARMVGL